MWHYFPKGHEKPLKQAVYNTVANICIVLAAAVVVAVYFILAPFIRPLYWALLCGTFLYPFKRSLTNVLRNWLQSLQSSGTPLLVGTAVLPLQVSTSAIEHLTKTIYEHWKLLVGVFVGLPCVYLLYNFAPLQSVFFATKSVLTFLYDFLGYFGSLWLWTLFISYFLVIVFLWTPETQKWLRLLTVPIWAFMLLHIANVAGALRAPLLIVMVIIMVIGFVAELNQAHQEAGDSSSNPSLYSTFCKVMGIPPTGDENAEPTTVVSPDLTQPTSLEDNSVSESPGSHEILKPDSLKLDTRKAQASGKNKQSGPGDNRDIKGEESTGHSVTYQYFIAVIIGHVIVRIWMHVWLVLLLFMVPILYSAVKKFGQQFKSGGMFYEQAEYSKDALSQWLDSRKDVLMPRGLRGLGKLALKGDQKMISVLEKGLDQGTSILFIFILLFGTFLFSIIAAAQIQRESMHMIESTQHLLNNTVSSDMAQWMPRADEMRSTMDQVLTKTHEYGRNFIASKVKEFVDGTEEEQDNVVNQVLEVWDTIYATMLSNGKKEKSIGEKNKSGHTESLSTFASLTSMDNLWQTLNQGTGIFQLSNLMEFVKANMSMFLSVLESIWTVVKGNMTLVMTVVTSVLSALLGGGTAILNFVLSAVIFLTTLFYLLSTSGDVYKPVEMFSGFSLGTSGTSVTSVRPGLGQAFEEAISGVFMASLKMASFYGLYTWLIHLIFGLDIVFIPSALAALFAAIPFLGPYWAALPAVFELWLVQGQGLSAALLFIAHMVPSYVVDTAIYSEIKGGHPYVTGLAIAGGMYCMGLEGAIIGPIILCCLIVVVNMYSSLLQSNEPNTPAPADFRSVSSDNISLSQRSRRTGEAPLLAPHSLQHF